VLADPSPSHIFFFAREVEGVLSLPGVPHAKANKESYCNIFDKTTTPKNFRSSDDKNVGSRNKGVGGW
jgi:hypothetical protein